MENKISLQKGVVVGMDVGGTDIKCAVVDGRGKMLKRFQRPAVSKKNDSLILKNILQVAQLAKSWARAKKKEIHAMGFGIPGIVSKSGVVHRSPHFPAWVDYPIQSELSSKLSLPLIVDNDANMAALGEGWLGVAKSWENYILFTLGTGIGGGIVIQRQVFRGDSGFAGEVGHMVLHKDGFSCACGGQGCLELYASASGIEKISPFSPKKLYQLALSGDKNARKIFNRLGENLGAGIASIVNILDVERVIVGGGLSGAWNIFRLSLQRGVQKHIYPTTAGKIRLVKAKLGNDAGVLGAAKAAWDLSLKMEEK